ncbi:MAG: PadR family transcriptional regulator [Thermoguttaceae bacterium]
MSGVYRFLKAMEGKGLVAGAWDLSERGPARKRYSITPEGRRCLVAWIKTLEDYRKRVSDLLRLARKTVAT